MKKIHTGGWWPLAVAGLILLASGLLPALPVSGQQGPVEGPDIRPLLKRHAQWLRALGDPALLDAMGLESGFITSALMEDPRRAHLRGRNLENLNYPGAVLRAAEMTEVNLSGAVLAGADLSHAVLTGADLSMAILEKANLGQAHLGGATLTGADLVGANLSNAVLTGADLRGANLAGADLTGARLSGADLTGANLVDAILKEADLNEAVLQSADLQNADLSGAQLNGGDLHGARLRQANLSGAQLFGANLDDAFLFETDLSRAILSGASLRGINLFANRLEGTSFKGVDLAGVVFDPSPEAAAALAGRLELFAQVRNLGMMTFLSDPAPLEQLRRRFKQAGYKKEELAITYAIRRGLRQQISENGTLYERLGGWVEFAFIEFPIEYGASPYRPFAVIFVLVMLFGFVYMIPLRYPSTRFGGIWKISPEGEFFGAGVNEVVEPLSVKTIFGLRIAFWFSFLSAFNIGGRIFNLDDLFMHCQRREYYLRGTLWVRTVSGVQALISIYLLVLTLLVYLEKIAF